MRWLSSKGPYGFNKGIMKRSGGILVEGGTVWEMAAASLHDCFS